jgi:two-component sensor histidine kinase
LTNLDEMPAVASPSRDMNALLKSARIRWLAYFAGWTLFALFFFSEDVSRSLYQGRRVEWRGYLIVWLTTASAWALLAPVVWYLASRVRIERQRWWKSIMIHLIASMIFAVAEETVFAAVTPLFGLPWFKPSFIATFRDVLPIDFHLNLIMYWLIVAGQHTASYYRRYRERERETARLQLRASELQNQLGQARLDALTMQLRPHFLFNTLNAIVVLVRQQRTHEADQMLTNLSDLLRQSLAADQIQEVPLREEIELLKLYLDIEHVRFQDRLQVEMNFEAETLEAAVPCLLLQPLVENAVRHGIAKTASGGRVTLGSRRIGSMLEISVYNDGPAITRQAEGAGVGLSNTRARLRGLYQEQQSLAIETGRDGGVTATVSLPFH